MREFLFCDVWRNLGELPVLFSFSSLLVVGKFIEVEVLMPSPDESEGEAYI
jgi:hypothetical protein